MIKFHRNILDWDTERTEMLKEQGVAPSRDSVSVLMGMSSVIAQKGMDLSRES